MVYRSVYPCNYYEHLYTNSSRVWSLPGSHCQIGSNPDPLFNWLRFIQKCFTVSWYKAYVAGCDIMAYYIPCVALGGEFFCALTFFNTGVSLLIFFRVF